mmetsp:Transcript_51141/g.95775  ORF Transcript_51141/g.95775 Transcript_51141/m.95775 type:complete len:620 (+) Transcript_51141:81-1940(+)
MLPGRPILERRNTAGGFPGLPVSHPTTPQVVRPCQDFGHLFSEPLADPKPVAWKKAPLPVLHIHSVLTGELLASISILRLTSTIQELKGDLSKVLKTPIRYQQLLNLEGHVLEDAQTLSAAGLSNDSVVNFVRLHCSFSDLKLSDQAIEDVEYVLESGQDPNVPNAEGKTPFQEVLQSLSNEHPTYSTKHLARKFLEYASVDLNGRCGTMVYIDTDCYTVMEGATALHCGAIQGDAGFCQMLLAQERFTAINETGTLIFEHDEGRSIVDSNVTAFHALFCSNCIEWKGDELVKLCKLFIADERIDINARTQKGYTVLRKAAEHLKYEVMYWKFEKFASSFEILQMLAGCERFADGLAHDGKDVYEILADMKDTTGRQCGGSSFMPPALRKFAPAGDSRGIATIGPDIVSGEKEGIATVGPDIGNEKEDRATKRANDAIHSRHKHLGDETPEAILAQVRQKKAELFGHLQELKTLMADDQEAESSWAHLEDTLVQQARSSAADICDDIQKLSEMRAWTTKVAMLFHRARTILGTEEGLGCATAETLAFACDGLPEEAFWEQLFSWPLDEDALLAHHSLDHPGGKHALHKQGHQTKQREHQSKMSKAKAGKMLLLHAFGED